MFVKTRIPKHTNCVRFYSSSTAEAYHLASLFLGGKGRLANALDLMEARIRYGFKHPIWQCYIITASTEWFGLDNCGRPLIVVLHNPSPLADEKLLCERYVTKRENNHTFNVVPREMFLDVLDGKYGEVKYVSLSDAIIGHNDNINKYQYLTKGQIEKDQLVKARLGNSYLADEYINAHHVGSIQENLEHCRRGDVETAFLQCNCGEYFPAFIGLTSNPQKYIQDLSQSPIDLATEAVGQFLCFGSVVNTNGNMMTSEIEPANTRSDYAFLAITDEKEEIILGDEVCMYAHRDYLKKLPSLFQSGKRLNFSEDDDPGVPQFFRVACFDGWYFTERLRGKVAIGSKQKEWFVTSDPTYCASGEPEFLVKSLKPLGRRTIKVLTSEGFYTSDIIKAAFKHPDANAFQIINGFKRRGKYYLAVVEYYNTDVYFDRFIPTEPEILKDYKLLGRII